MKRLLILSALVISLIFAGSVQAGIGAPPSLTYLIDTQSSITAGDKVFDQWRLLGDENLNMDGLAQIFPDLNYITVSPLSDGGLDPGPGLNFQANGELGVSGEEFIHLLFGFRVTTIDDLLIKDNSLQLTAGLRSLVDTGSNGFSISESIFDVAGNLLGEKYVEFSWTDGQETTIFSDSADFSPTDMIFVVKDILVWNTTTLPNAAYLEEFNQRFSQTQVPEPATMLLLGTGLVGVAGAARRKKKNQA